jgi:hypothetical protein
MMGGDDPHQYVSGVTGVTPDQYVGLTPRVLHP